MRASSVDEIVVVAGAYPLETDARVVECPDWPRGMGASLRCGLAALDDGVEAAVVCLADGPELKAAAIDRVIVAWRGASRRGTRGELRRQTAATLCCSTGQSGRTFPTRAPGRSSPRSSHCDDLGAPGDVDYPEDLPERLRPGSL